MEELRECPRCLDVGKHRKMEYLEDITTFVCRTCGFSERQFTSQSDSTASTFDGQLGLDPLAPIGTHRGSYTKREWGWTFDPGYGAFTQGKGKYRKVYDPGKAKKNETPKFGYYVPKGCGHNQTRIKVGDFTVWATESWQVDWSGKRAVKPDFGVYLSVVWMGKFDAVFMNDAACGCLGMETPYPAIFVDWADQKAISLALYTKLVTFVISKLAEGRTVEIGCQGAHGRTGTLLAGILGKLEKKSAVESVLTLRARYCKKAVESKSQLELIRAYLVQEGIEGQDGKAVAG